MILNDTKRRLQRIEAFLNINEMLSWFLRNGQIYNFTIDKMSLEAHLTT